MLTTGLKVMLWNVENLFLLSDQQLKQEHLQLDEKKWRQLSTSVYENKPLEKTKAIARVILEENPDCILLCEVGGLESLQNFNRLFLNEAYSPALIEGNSDRNIDVAFLIKKGHPFYFDINTNKNRSINYLYPHERQSLATGYPPKNGKLIHSHKFSRDAAELHLFLNDRNRPFLIFILAHLKSRLDPQGLDPFGFERRQAELRTLLEIYHELDQQFQGEVPIAVAGDMNGNASHLQTDEEFRLIYESSPLKDVCHLAGLSAEESATFYQVGRSSRVEGRQIDYCFLSPKLVQHLETESVRVHRYKGVRGLPLDPPTTLEAKLNLPSDHYPLIFHFKNLPLR
jgi:hypothetical protein